MGRLVLENLRKQFGELVAVDDLNLEVKSGEFVCLLGPSGCGKTTTLRMVAGLQKPDSGKVFIDDVDMTYAPPQKRGLGLVFQSWAIFNHMTAYDNIAFGLKVRKKPVGEIKSEVQKMVELLKLEEMLNVKAKALSQFEIQKVAIARTLVTDPTILLLDEPLSNLDAPLRAVMRDKLLEIHRDLRKTILYVTHDQLDAMMMADRVALMDIGVLQQYDTPDGIYNRPVNKFVANFIGTPTMNYINCTYVTDEEKRRAYLDSGAFKYDATEFKNIIEEKSTSTALIFGIRPQDVQISHERSSDESIKASVDLVEPLGSNVILHLAIDGIFIQALVKREFKTRPGAEMWVGFPRERIHLFDGKTERRIV